MTFSQISGEHFDNIAKIRIMYPKPLMVTTNMTLGDAFEEYFDDYEDYEVDRVEVNRKGVVEVDLLPRGDWEWEWEDEEEEEEE